ncbi:MAG: SLC13 family permease [Bdellovibrionota bacterium]
MISFLMLLTLWFLLQKRYPVKFIELQTVRTHFKAKLKSLGPLSREELQVAAVFSLTVFFWIVPGLLTLLFPTSEFVSTLSTRASMSVVGIGGALILFILPSFHNDKLSTNLEWEDAKQIDWGTIMLFGGGLTLGAMLNQTGLAEVFGNQLFIPENGIFLLAVSGVVFSILMSEFASNTASSLIIIPMILAVLANSTLGSISSTVLVVGCAMGASFGFMLPVSTPPNAIIYGTGRITVREMVRAGVLFDIAGAVLIVLATIYFFPLVF